MIEQIDRKQMKKAPKNLLEEPFGLINYWDKPDGSGRMVMAFIKTDKIEEGSRMGIAIDGSGSMKELFGYKQAFPLPPKPNHVKAAAQEICKYLASKSADGKVAVIYWATGAGGKDIQAVGDLTKDEAEKCEFAPPLNYGTGTQLLPALKYFTDGVQRTDLKEAAFGMYVFITDGQMEDLEDVIKHCKSLATDIEAGRREEFKLVMIGFGTEVNEDQLDRLDNMDTGTDWDPWFCILASDLEEISEIDIELSNPDMILAPGDGMVRDESGAIIANYRDTGLPARLDFTLPRNACKSFSLEVGGVTIRQPLP